MAGLQDRAAPAVHALIFDMDGTMIDSMGHHRQSWLAFAQRYGVDIDPREWMRDSTGRTGYECMCRLFGRTLTMQEASALIAEKEAIFRASYASAFGEVAGLGRFIAYARSLGLPMAIGTASSRDNVRFVLQHLALPGPPEIVVGGDEGFPGKPAPAIFLEAALRMGQDPAHCLVFEDSPHGIEAARRAGMRAVALCTTHTPDALQGPHVLAAVDDYLALLDPPFLQEQ